MLHSVGVQNVIVAGLFTDQCMSSTVGGLAEGRLTRPVTVAQGTRINRSGRVSIQPDDNSKSILIGGPTHIIVDGIVTL